MTLIMVWREADFDRLWIVSDSRLSAPGAGGGVVRLTDRAAKVLEAQLVLQGPNPLGPPIETKAVGFAYAGSSLVALQSYVAVLPLWSRLRSSGEQSLPRMAACAAHVGEFVEAYVREVAASGDFGCATECVVLGFDALANAVEAWRVAAWPSKTGVQALVEQLHFGPGEMRIFGSGREEALAQLGAFKPQSGMWRREPLDMVRAQLRKDGPGTVGGGVQIGVANVSGFEIASDVRFFEAGVSCADDPLFAMRYRGFDLEKVSRVGHTFSALPGISG